MSKPLTIALGMNLQAGAFGGGNQFGVSLTDFLCSRGHQVIHTLAHPSIDLIVLTETRPWLKTAAFSGHAAVAYRRRHPRAKIIFRVNECDEKRGTKLKLLNQLIAAHARAADQVVYISAWLRDLFTAHDATAQRKSTVIRNGADATIFNRQGYRPWDGVSPLRLVTHHWSSNWHKGFDVYQQLDRELGLSLRGKVTFTYIGNMPSGIRFANIQIIPPQSGKKLAEVIHQHHVYLTASQYEPAGMHHIEGALCGLPLLYRKSGGLPEYCQGFGIAFEGPTDFPNALQAMMTSYQDWRERMSSYPYTAQKMCQGYLNLFTTVAAAPHQLIPSLPGQLAVMSSALFLKETIANFWR